MTHNKDGGIVAPDTFATTMRRLRTSQLHLMHRLWIRWAKIRSSVASVGFLICYTFRWVRLEPRCLELCGCPVVKQQRHFSEFGCLFVRQVTVLTLQGNHVKRSKFQHHSIVVHWRAGVVQGTTQTTLAVVSLAKVKSHRIQRNVEKASSPTVKRSFGAVVCRCVWIPRARPKALK